jgi:hypothetical protein
VACGSEVYLAEGTPYSKEINRSVRFVEVDRKVASAPEKQKAGVAGLDDDSDQFITNSLEK